MAKYVTEFIGTFFLVFTIGLCIHGGMASAPLAIGFSLMVMVYMGGHVSGAHYNPAVSLAVLLRKKMPSGDFVPYVIAQVAGALVAAFATNLVLGTTFAPVPGEGTSTLGAVLIEVLYTFALALTVLNVACSDRTKGNSFYGLAIGFAVAVGAFAGGPISGGAFNPAVGIGPTIVNALLGGGGWGSLWIYLVGPFTGAALAAVVFGMQEGAA